MKRRICALLLTLCLLLPFSAPAEGNPILPDLAAFAGNLLTPGDTEDFGFCNRVTLYGEEEHVKLTAEAYIALLLESYDICQYASFTLAYDLGQSLRYYALGYTGAQDVGVISYSNEDEGWQITNAAIILSYSQYHSDNFIQLTYHSEFACCDTGDRVAVPKASYQQMIPAAPTPRSGTESSSTRTSVVSSVSICPLCEGTGAYKTVCGVCDGAGVSTATCAACKGQGRTTCSNCAGNKYTTCGSCSGHGTRSCSTCGGSGHHSSSKHSSSHHSSSDSTCATCGGDGQRSCPNCSGNGRKDCAVCRATGTRTCSSCQAGAVRIHCTDCDGSGHQTVNCIGCGGSGVLK